MMCLKLKSITVTALQEDRERQREPNNFMS